MLQEAQDMVWREWPFWTGVPEGVSPSTLRCPCVFMFSYIQLVATPWSVAHPAPLSMGFPRQ